MDTEIHGREHELLSQFQQKLTALEESGAGMPFVFTPSQAFMLLGGLQLLLRHPGMKEGPTPEFLRGLAENI